MKTTKQQRINKMIRDFAKLSGTFITQALYDYVNERNEFAKNPKLSTVERRRINSLVKEYRDLPETEPATAPAPVVAELETVVKAMLADQDAVNAQFANKPYSWENESARLSEISRILNQSIGKLDFIVSANGGKSQIEPVETAQPESVAQPENYTIIREPVATVSCPACLNGQLDGAAENVAKCERCGYTTRFISEATAEKIIRSFPGARVEATFQLYSYESARTRSAIFDITERGTVGITAGIEFVSLDSIFGFTVAQPIN